jgi:hypothetical protein
MPTVIEFSRSPTIGNGTVIEHVHAIQYTMASHVFASRNTCALPLTIPPSYQQKPDSEPTTSWSVVHMYIWRNSIMTYIKSSKLALVLAKAAGTLSLACGRVTRCSGTSRTQIPGTPPMQALLGGSISNYFELLCHIGVRINTAPG